MRRGADRRVSLEIVGSGAPGAVDGRDSYKDVLNRFRSEQRALAELTINSANNPLLLSVERELTRGGPGVNTDTIYLTYTVPVGQVARIDGIGMSLSRPWVWASSCFRWRLRRNGESIPTFQTFFLVGGIPWMLRPFGTPEKPEQIEPVYIQSGQTFELEGQSGAVLLPFESYCLLEFVATGKLFSPATAVGG